MRIGSRWRAGEAPPAGLPPVLVAAIAAAEATEATDGWWTLTWLEGRPVAEHDSGERLAVDAEGRIRTDPDDADDDDWLT